MRVVTTYEVVKHQAQKRLPCPGCGKRLTRQRTFQQTINPFNRNPDGSTRTLQDIQAILRLQADLWAKLPEYHDSCRPLRVGPEVPF